MTKKEYYDRLLAAAEDGTFPSTGLSGFGCFYRGDQTPTCKQRCAVGLLIPDEIYDKRLEGCFVSSLHDNFLLPLIPEGLSREDLEIIQCIHDDHTLNPPWDSKSFIHQINHLKCFQEYQTSCPT